MSAQEGPAPDGELSPLLRALGIAALCATGALAGLLDVLLVPLYVGSTLVPLGALFAIVGNIALPRLAFSLHRTTLAAAAPFLTWLVVVVGFGVVTRPEGDVTLPGGSAQWGSYLMLLGGTLVGAGTVATAVPPRRPPGNRPSGAPGGRGRGPGQPVKGSRLPSRKAS